MICFSLDLNLLKEKTNFEIYEEFNSLPKEKSLQKSGARFLLKTALSKMGLEGYSLKKSQSGKPYLINRNGETLFASISHSKNSAVFAISEDKIGVDIETIKQINEKIPKRCFSDLDQSFILNSKNKERDTILLWSFRESLFKAVDNENFFSLSKSVSFTDGKDKINSQIMVQNKNPKEIFKIYYKFFDNFALTVIYKGESEKLLSI